MIGAMSRGRSAPTFEAKVGATVAGVRLTEPIESGAKLTCWRARRDVGGEVVVHTLSSDASKRERDTFVRAAQRIVDARKERHIPGVVPLSEVVPAAGAAIADFEASGTLADLPVLDWEFARKFALARRVGLILSGLHGRGLFHGCMRPQNVLLDSQFEPALSDVGALVIEDSFPGTADTRHEYWAYAAREVRQGQAPDARSDVFSLGRLLQFILLGDEPDEPDDNLPKLDALADAPAGLVRIVRKSTSRDAAQRYASVDEFLSDLDRYQDAGAVGLTHPDGLEGTERRRDSITMSSPELRASMRGEPPVAEAKRSDSRLSDVGKADAATKADAEKARVVPMQVVRSTATVESIDPIGGRLAFALGFAGLLVFATGAGLAFRAGDVARNFQIVGVLGGVLLSAWLPGFSRWYLMRPLWAAIGVVLVIFGQPLEFAAAAGRQSKFSRGTPAQRGDALASLAQHGQTKFRDLDLTAADFSGHSLAGIDFTGTKLGGAKFERANLERVNFSDADIRRANFFGARLEGAQVSGSIGWREALCDERTTMPAGWSCVDEAPKSDNDVAGLR